MKPVKFAVFYVALATAVVTAVSTLGAQEPRRAQEPRPGPSTLREPQGRPEQGRGTTSLGAGPSTSLGAGSQLGVTVRDLEVEPEGSTRRTDPKASALRAGEGVRIEAVASSSPAEKAGLKVGDIVVEYDGERVRSARQFTRLVQETPEGRSVKIAVLRNGQRQTVDATPEARAFTWNMEIDDDQIRREVERGMRGLREFRFEDLPAMRSSPRGPSTSLGAGPSTSLGAGRLGVTVQSLSPQLAEYFGAKDGGVLVSSVTNDSPADKAGIKAGDVITSVNGDKVRDSEDLMHELSGATGPEVSIGVLRDKRETTVKAGIRDR